MGSSFDCFYVAVTLSVIYLVVMTKNCI
uniref:Uncharacterized protein n=1 Tax=Anguilla anguilla TaxID=7936 RepID=A0A0E9VMH5_ANGAN